VEGSSLLLRPYGYFGGVAGVVAVALIGWAAGVDPWRLVSAMAVGGCVTQAFGRLRCLVQGCCHGRAVSASWGITYRHPRPRVLRLSGLGGVPVHPTPLYSIVWTLVVCAALLRLWTLAAPLPFIGGMYLILIGLGRFVEEHYRGEPQTAWVAGLRLYQWLAIAFVLSGAIVTAVGGAPAPPPGRLATEMWPALALLGGFTYFAFGVDFPRSSRKFSRLV
jgi:prolipoprotein diacylglyceryltransferase